MRVPADRFQPVSLVHRALDPHDSCHGVRKVTPRRLGTFNGRLSGPVEVDQQLMTISLESHDQRRSLLDRPLESLYRVIEIASTTGGRLGSNGSA